MVNITMEEYNKAVVTDAITVMVSIAKEQCVGL